MNFDRHSLAADPKFDDPAGPDGVLGFSTAPDTSVPAQIIDNDSTSGFSTNGDWALVTGSGYNNDYLESTSTAGLATYTFNVAGLVSGGADLAGRRRQ